MQKLHQRLGISYGYLIEKITRMYWEENLSQLKISKKLNCDITTVEKFFRCGDIKSRNLSEAGRINKQRIAKINDYQVEVLNGLMLSDFHIESGTFQARLSFGFKHLEFADLCIKELNCFEWIPPKQDKSTGCWHSKTKFYENLQDYKNIWYLKRKKIIPSIDISPTTLLFWFLGDGTVAKNGYGAILCTEAFSNSENKNLSKKILKLGIPNNTTPSNRIRILGHYGYIKMLEIIGKCPIECYKYKFKYEYNT